MMAFQVVSNSGGIPVSRPLRTLSALIAFMIVISLDGWVSQIGAVDAKASPAGHPSVIISTEDFDPAALTLDAFGD